MQHTKLNFNYFKSPEKDNQEGCHIIFYSEWGDAENKDVVLCVHGLSRNCRDFDYLAKALSANFRVICVDIAGRGKSEWLSDKSEYDYETYVTDVLALLEHLGIKKVNWVGTSMGGIIGMIIAASYPDLIKNLVLNDIGPIVPGNAISRIISVASATSEFSTQEDAEYAFRQKMVPFGIKEEEHWHHLIKHSIVKKLDGKYSFSYDPAIVPPTTFPQKLRILLSKIIPFHKISAFKDVRLMDLWDKITCPILAVRGKESDFLTDEIAQEMLSSNKDIQIVAFDGIGHAPMLMEKSQIAPVEEWLLKVGK